MAFRTLFGSGFQMAAILFLPFENRTEVYLTSSLDRFIRKGHKNIFEENIRSGFQMVWRPFCFCHLKSGPDIFSLA
jgi:hypothetical protein